MSVSIYFIAAGIGWLVAQIAKYLVSVAKKGTWYDASTFLHSGNMPSVHTATIVSLTIVIGVVDGLDSAIFALAVLMTAIVAYDAMGVRRTAGEQGKALRKLIKDKKDYPYQALGHTPLEVAVGAMIGALSGIAVAFFTSTIVIL